MSTDMERVLLFEIWDGNKHYRIYADGHLEGFSESARILNHATHVISQIVYTLEERREVQEAMRAFGEMPYSECRQKRPDTLPL